MKKTGELLKLGRERSNLTLSEVALATKINPKVLIAIESGDERNLPAKTFLKGFVRSYAIFLKMDVDDVLKCFVEDTGGPPPTLSHEAYQKQDPTTQPARRSVSTEGSSGMRTAAIVVIVLLICAIIGVRELVDKYQRERTAASVPADLKVSPLTDSKTKVVSEPRVSPSSTAPKPQSFPAPMTHPEPAILSSASLGITKIPETPVVLPTVVAKHEPASTASPTLAPSEPSAIEGAPAAPAPRANSHEVIVEALDQVSLKVDLAGEIKQIQLAPNEVYIVRASGGIALEVSDGGAVSLIHNGRVRGVPGKLGEPKQVKIP